MMRWTVRLEARTDQGEVETTELVTFSRPAIVNTLAEIELTLAKAKALLRACKPVGFGSAPVASWLTGRGGRCRRRA
jgi:hypothetical protein